MCGRHFVIDSSQLRSKMPNHFLLLRVVLFVTCASWGFLETSAQGPVLTMMSGEQCFGTRVELLCTHPDPFDDSGKYLPQSIAWAEDGTTIDFTDPASARFTPTRLNSTASTLSFDITEEDHRDRVILCSCFLTRNNPNRDRDESEALVLDPPEKAPSPVVQSMPTSTSNILRWTPGPGCYRHRTFTFNLTWTKMVDPPDSPSSGSNMTTATQYDFSSLPRGEYLVSIQGKCNEKPSVESNMTSVVITLTAPISSPGTTRTPTTDPPADWTVLIIIVVVVVIVMIAIVALIIVGFTCICVCCKKSKTPPSEEVYSKHQHSGPSEGTFGQDEKNSTTPFYANVEMNDGSVPMTTNPSYGQIELSGIHNKPIYGNL